MMLFSLNTESKSLTIANKDENQIPYRRKTPEIILVEEKIGHL